MFQAGFIRDSGFTILVDNDWSWIKYLLFRVNPDPVEPFVSA